MRKLGIAGLVLVTMAILGLMVTPFAFGQQRPRFGNITPPVITAAPFGSYLGISIRDVEREDVSKWKLPNETGAVIQEVRSGTPAASAGFRAEDVVVEFDGERVRGAQQLTRLVRETPPGRRVKAAVIRDGRRTELEVTPAEPQGGAGVSFDPDLLRGSIDGILPFRAQRGLLGVTTQEMTPELAQYFGAKDGILVTSVASDTPAQRAGLRVADVITKVGGAAVNDSRDLVREVQTRQGEVELTIVRDKKEQTVKVTVEGRVRARTRAFRGI